MAGNDLERVETSMQVAQTGNQSTHSDGASDVLMQAEVEVGSMQVTECTPSVADSGAQTNKAESAPSTSLECAPTSAAASGT